MTVRCMECGSDDVESVVWWNHATRETVGDFGSWDEADTKWCNNCAAHKRLDDDEVDAKPEYTLARAESAIRGMEALNRSRSRRNRWKEELAIVDAARWLVAQVRKGGVE